jgi:hypothetical protein
LPMCAARSYPLHPTNALDWRHVKKMNLAELDYWRRSQHTVADVNYRRLMFEAAGANRQGEGL